MLRASHRQIGIYLAQNHLKQANSVQQNAFLWGCEQPDRNPLTYLKGSVKCRLLHGHNYPNAAAYMSRLSRRLEGKKHWGLLDYYSLGKLIHYITDAFTYSHNEGFPSNLVLHRKYEASLQQCFLAYLKQPSIQIREDLSVFDTITCFHREYRSHPPAVHHDIHYAINACCSVIAVLTGRQN